MIESDDAVYVVGMADVVDLLQKILDKLDDVEQAIDELRESST